jgi:hypothetical protein
MSVLSASAQDVLVKKSGEEIKVKVIEVGIHEIKYKMFDNPDGPVFVMKKDELLKIRYENGTETLILPDPLTVNQEHQILDRRRVVKTEFILPLAGAIAFGYEQVLKVGTNLEGKVGIIGPGFGDARGKANGAFVKGGIKFLSGQDFYVEGMRYMHPLKGKYVKLEMMYSHFRLKDRSLWYSSSNQTTDIILDGYALNLVFGKQSILGNAMTLDWYFGIGFGGASRSYTNPNVTSSDYYPVAGYYSHTFMGRSFPLVISGGLAIGVVFK